MRCTVDSHKASGMNLSDEDAWELFAKDSPYNTGEKDFNDRLCLSPIFDGDSWPVDENGNFLLDDDF